MDPLLISSAVQAGSGLLQGITGLFQKGKAKRMARENPRPTYRMPGSVMDNQRLSQSRAGQGLSDAALQVYDQSNDRALTTSTEAILKGGGSVNNISELYAANISGRQKMALLDDEMRARNIQNLIQQNNQLADYKDKEWQINVFAPFADKAQAAATLAKQGSDNFWKGINTVGSAAANYFMGNQFKKEGDTVYGQPTNGTMASEGMAGGPQFSQGGNMMGGYNWMDLNAPPPQRPVQQPQSPYGNLSSQWPGLMYGSIYSKDIYQESGGQE